MLAVQLAVLISTLAITLLSALLSIFLTKAYVAKKIKSYAFWSLGLWLFTLGAFLEIIFALGIYSKVLVALYLFIVALLVEALAIGSVYLTKNRKLKYGYMAYTIVVSLALLLVLATSRLGNPIINYVVYGQLPLVVVLLSSFATFPAAALLIAIAALSYKHKRNNKMLSIIAGTLVVSVAGTLYIASIPEFLYFSEFAGIVLLWLGFFRF